MKLFGITLKVYNILRIIYIFILRIQKKSR